MQPLFYPCGVTAFACTNIVCAYNAQESAFPVRRAYTISHKKNNEHENITLFDVGFDCKAVVQVNTEEVLQQTAEHARRVHSVNVTLDITWPIKTLIRKEEPQHLSF